jgi:hypothetical protein
MMLGGGALGGLRAYTELRVLIRAWAAVREDTRARAQVCAGHAVRAARVSVCGCLWR